MGQFIATVLVVPVLVVALVLWLCMVSVHVAAIVAIIVVYVVILMCVSAISGFIGHRQVLRDFAECRCPQCHQTLGPDTASRAKRDALRNPNYERDNEEFEEWPVECPHCKCVSYFEPATGQIYAEAWTHRTAEQQQTNK